MADLWLYDTNFHFGTQGDDTLSAGPGNFVLIGLEGNNTLTSQWDDWDMSQGTLAGGSGNDTYHAYGDMTQIIDRGGNDTVYLPGYRDEYEGALLDGRDLVLVNAWTGQVLMVLDFTSVGRIETFIDAAGEHLSGAQVEQLVRAEGHGNITYRELQSLTGDYSIPVTTFAAARELDIAIVSLNWDNVFHHIDSRGSSDNTTIADAIQYELLPTLSPAASELWHSSGAYQALLDSRYNGVEANLQQPDKPALPQRLVEDMALLYQAALDRKPDVAGLNYFVDNLREGQSLQDVANSFYLAGEFREQFEHFDDARYIDQLYVNVLGRPADEPGTQYWLNDINNNGRSHADVLVSFAQSAENRENAADWLAGLQYATDDGNWVL